MATPAEESRLGVYLRHEGQHAIGLANPRHILDSYHDEAVNGFASTLAKVGHTLDRLRVIDRSNQTLYDSAAKANEHPNAMQALAAGQRLTDIKLIAVVEGWQSVEASAQKRGAKDGEVTIIQGHRQSMEDLQKERIHRHAMRNLDANAGALTKDPRYSQHIGAELAKAAYFRGFHEKASEFKGERANFPKYDTAASDRQLLKQFPDVEDLKVVGLSRSREHSRADDDHSL